MGFYSVSKGCVGLEWLEMSSIGLLWVLCFYVAFDEDIDFKNLGFNRVESGVTLL